MRWDGIDWNELTVMGWGGNGLGRNNGSTRSTRSTRSNIPSNNTSLHSEQLAHRRLRPRSTTRTPGVRMREDIADHVILVCEITPRGKTTGPSGFWLWCSCRAYNILELLRLSPFMWPTFSVLLTPFTQCCTPSQCCSPLQFQVA